MNAAPGRSSNSAAWAALSFVLAGVLVPVVISRAWVADDAYISYRVIDNFVSGYGLRWNIADRVQVFTHPLWLLLQIPIYALTRSAGVTMLVASTACVFVALWRIARDIAPAPLSFAALGMLPLVAHQRLLDFLWSGLETPLLLALLVIVASATVGRAGCEDRRTVGVTVAAAGIAITRPDATLIVLPLVAATFLARASLRQFLLMLAAGSPSLLWSGFAWLYFGSPFPNTALAKLGAPWPQAERWRSGLRYLEDAMRTDPILVVAAFGALGLLVQAVRRRRASAGAWLALGAWLHAVWVVRSGGDFMSGRFLLPAYIGWWIACALELGSAGWTRRSAGAAVAATGILVVAGHMLKPEIPPIRSDAFWEYAEAHPIDERRYYQGCFSVLNPAYTGGRRESGDDLVDVDGRLSRARGGGQGERYVTTAFEVGWIGFSQGPGLHIVDAFGLVDPVIARAPLEPGKPTRPGHLQRVLPDGYVEYLVSGDESLLDPDFARWAIPQRIVVEAPILDPVRLRWLTGGVPARDLSRNGP